jgi:hypothetical protein
MRFVSLFVCHLSLVSGLGALEAGLAANAFGGGIKGALLADQFFGGRRNDFFDTYLTANALNDPSSSNLLLAGALTGGGNFGFNGAVNTALTANALADDPNSFLLASALSGGLNSGTFGAAALSNSLGGGLTGALAANALVNGNVNGNFNNNWYGGDYWYPGGYWGNSWVYPSTYYPTYYPSTYVYPSATFAANVNLATPVSAYASVTGCWVSGIWQDPCFWTA